MNCCDDYGDCRQGRDCPVRQHHQADRVERAITVALYAGAVVVTIATAVACVAIIAWAQSA